VQQINNCIRNQFELPVLFYVLCLMFWSLAAIDPFVQIAAWTFVLSRIAHAWEHMGSNRVPRRRRWFTLGVLIVLVMLALAAWRILAGVLPH
jgi:hypothetical protein